MNFRTKEELEKYVREKLQIPNVDFSNMDLEVASSVVEALTKCLNNYPELNSTIEAIGSPMYLWNVMERLKFIAFYPEEIEDLQKNQEKQISGKNATNDNPMTLYPITIRGKQKFCLELEPSLINQQKEDIARNVARIRNHSSIQEEDTIQSILYHEFGHMLDHVLKISKDCEVFSIIVGTGISSEEFYYNSRDLLAEGFSDYYSSKEPSMASALLVSYINKKYNEQFAKQETKPKTYQKKKSSK